MNNLVILVGNVGARPELVTYPDTGNRLAKFQIAVRDFSSKTDGGTQWFSVNAWNALADRVHQHVTKGREIAIQGRLSINKYEKRIGDASVKVSSPVIKLTSFHLCGKKPLAESDEPQSNIALLRSLSLIVEGEEPG